MKAINIGGREFPTVVWYKHACLRQLYFYVAVIWLSSAAGGFDGSMMNGLQTLSYWENYFHNPSPSTLGLMNAIVPVGNLLTNLFVPWMADVSEEIAPTEHGQMCILTTFTALGPQKNSYYRRHHPLRWNHSADMF